MLKKCNLFSCIAVIVTGMLLLTAAAPLSTAAFQEEAEETMPAYGNCIMGEDAGTQAEPIAEFVMKDWWDIIKPDMSGMEITVVNSVGGSAEADAGEAEDLTVTALGLEESMEPVEEEDEPDELAVLSAGETAGRTLKQEEAVTLSASELDCLQRIVQAEAGDEDIMGKILVANVVLNRYHSEKFPNTIEGVVTQTSTGSCGLVYQFTPAKPGGRYWTAVPSEETIEAVERALNGEDYSEGALYFASRKYADASHMSWFDRKLTWLFRHGNHEFYIG